MLTQRILQNAMALEELIKEKETLRDDKQLKTAREVQVRYYLNTQIIDFIDQFIVLCAEIMSCVIWTNFRLKPVTVWT